MKFRTSERELKAESIVYAVGYCDLQNLFNYKTPVAYTTGQIGWKSDIYFLSGNTYISTGYQPCGYNLHDDWIVSAFNRKADTLYYEAKYEEREKKIEELFKLFCKVVHADYMAFHSSTKIWTKEDKARFKEEYEKLIKEVEKLTGYNEKTAYDYTIKG